MLKDEKVRIANIYGNNAIVQKDFFEGLDVSQKYFDISDHSCNITSSTAIISKLKEISALDMTLLPWSGEEVTGRVWKLLMT